LAVFGVDYESRGMTDRLENLDPVRRLIRDRAEARGTDLKTLSLQLDKNPTYLHQFITKGSPRKLDGDDRKKLAALLGLDEAALKPGGSVREFSASIERVVGVEYARIPLYDIRASAGRGSLAADGEPIGWRLFEMDWIRGIAGTKLDQLAVVKVSGDSMWDTLHDGDHVLVDRGRRALAQPGIFVLALDAELIVKRVSMDFQSRAVTIISDNPKYPPQTVDDPELLRVVGRVIWLGRSVG
jgi:phage repressor protein C with HTH and peptisase S24 domain